ncbi:MAG: hypothetical protein KIT73_06380, partial [Burkholderiales bacterium]|nr:hypothetical protein [Burkholderiales bacterium]
WQLPDSVSNMVREASGIALKAQSQFARVAGAETLEYQRAVLNLLEQSVGKWPGAELAVTAAKATLRSTTAAMETVQLTVQHTTELMGSGLAKTLAPKPGTAR